MGELEEREEAEEVARDFFVMSLYFFWVNKKEGQTVLKHLYGTTINENHQHTLHAAACLRVNEREF
ncbi:hypothetical protein LP414_26025 [Polaromonas sp. P1(28)-13]|nr:hypothetical protein LP414_26025 [Polaromonas sp. P1(28)-13]